MHVCEHRAQLAHILQDMLQFCEDIKETTGSINTDIHQLKGRCLDGFASVEQCRATQQRNQVRVRVCV